MTTRNLLFLISGMIIGVIGSVIYCTYTGENDYQFQPEIIARGMDGERALVLRTNYTETFRDDYIQGYNISLPQYLAIDSTIRRTLNSDLSKTSGFRLYKGLATKNDPNSEKSFIVYPIDNHMIGQNPTRVFVATGFDDKYILPCPRFCD